MDHNTSVAGGQLSSHLEYNHSSSVIFPLTPDQAKNRGEAYGRVNATVRWTAPKYAGYLQAGVLNATTSGTARCGADDIFGGVVESLHAPPAHEIRLGGRASVRAGTAAVRPSG